MGLPLVTPWDAVARVAAMSDETTDDPRADRREQLIDAAVAAVRTHGAGASMEQIAAAAGVTKPVLYRYFGDKAGLYEAVADRFVGVVNDAVVAALDERSTDPQAMLAATVDAYLSLVQRDTDMYRFLMRRARLEQTAARDRIDTFVRALGDRIGDLLLTQYASAGGAVDPATARVWAHGIVGMINAVGDWWVQSDERSGMSREDVVRAVTDLLWRGLPAAAPLPR